MSFLLKSWMVIPIVSITVFFLIYVWYDRMYSKVQNKITFTRNEMMRLMDLMFMEVNPSRLNIILLLMSFGLGIAVILLLWPHFTLGIILGTILGLVGWQVPLLMTKSLYEKRCSRFVDQMVDGLTMMANGIKSGLSLNQSMQRVVENMGNPLSQEFRLVISQTQMGRSMEEALIELGERIPRPDVQVFVTAVNILKETGGNLAENFTTIVFTIRERQKVEKKIEAMTAQGMMQGLIVSLVPVILIMVFFLIDPGYIMPMFTTPLGLVLTFVMFSLIIIGGLAIKKIVTIKV